MDAPSAGCGLARTAFSTDMIRSLLRLRHGRAGAYELPTPPGPWAKTLTGTSAHRSPRPQRHTVFFHSQKEAPSLVLRRAPGRALARPVFDLDVYLGPGSLPRAVVSVPC